MYNLEKEELPNPANQHLQFSTATKFTQRQQINMAPHSIRHKAAVLTYECIKLYIQVLALDLSTSAC